MVTAVPYAAISLIITTFLAASALFLEHDRSLKPSSLLIAYLVFSALFEAVQIRTLLLRSDFTALAGTLTAALVCKLGLLLLEVRSKGAYLRSPYSEYPPEALVSILNRGLFWWLNQMFFIGWKTGLTAESLTEIDISLGSALVEARILPAWRKRKSPKRCAPDFSPAARSSMLIMS